MGSLYIGLRYPGRGGMEREARERAIITEPDRSVGLGALVFSICSVVTGDKER